METHVKISIDKWNSKVNSLIGREKAELEDLSYWLKNPYSMLLFDSVEFIVEELFKVKFSCDNLKIKTSVIDNKLNLHLFIDGEDSERMIINPFYGRYEVLDKSFNSDFWERKLKDMDKEYNIVCEDIIKVDKALSVPRVFRFFYRNSFSRLSDNFLIEYRKDLVEFKSKFDNGLVEKTYKDKIFYCKGLEESIEGIIDYITGLDYLEGFCGS